MTAKPTDEALAAAYRDLEGCVSDLANMAMVLTIVHEDVLGTRGGEVEKWVHSAVPITRGSNVFVLNSDEISALDFAISNLHHLCRAVHQSYHQGFDEARPAEITIGTEAGTTGRTLTKRP